ncbi:MAG TPA: type II toxin-antitoxin system death-on-curing family toxin [Gemmatirosa sp.]
MRQVNEQIAPAYVAESREPKWMTRREVEFLHEQRIAEHGGLPGVNSEHLIESALARPLNLYAYIGGDLPRLGAAYAYGLAKNHGFRDANKRTAFATCAVFLYRNGLRLEVDEHDAVATMLELATNAISEEGFAEWLRMHVVARR